MLKMIFEGVLLLSLVGSAAALLLLAVRPLTRRMFSPRWQYYSWLLVLCALLLPLPRPAATVVYQPQTAPAMLGTAVDSPIRQVSEVLGTTAPQPTVDWFFVCAVIWAVGVAFTLCIKMTRYRVFCEELCHNSRTDERAYDLPEKLAVRRTWLLDAPLVIGLIRPTLYLPEAISDADLRYVLAHESTHYKRRDLLYKWLVLAVASVHWFNPLMRVISRQIDAECEASCDFEVTRRLSDAETADYMSMILGRFSAAGQCRPLTTRMASSKAVLKRRFLTIRNGRETGRKMRFVSVAVALMLLATIAFSGAVLANQVWAETVVVYTEAPALPLKAGTQPPEEPPVGAEPPVLSETPEHAATLAENEPETPEQPVQPGEVVDLVYSTEMSADRILGMVQKPLSGADILSLSQTAKEVTYNSDEKKEGRVRVYPDEQGRITVFFDSPEPRFVAKIEIRNADHPGGWGYTLPTDSKIAYEFGGFDPGAEYVVTIDTYCPGNYGIAGRALIY